MRARNFGIHSHPAVSWTSGHTAVDGWGCPREGGPGGEERGSCYPPVPVRHRFLSRTCQETVHQQNCVKTFFHELMGFRYNDAGRVQGRGEGFIPPTCASEPEHLAQNLLAHRRLFPVGTREGHFLQFLQCKEVKCQYRKVKLQCRKVTEAISPSFTASVAVVPRPQMRFTDRCFDTVYSLLVEPHSILTVTETNPGAFATETDEQLLPDYLGKVHSATA